MAYEKQTWVDRVTPLDAEHMNHIEDGIAALVGIESITQTTTSTSDGGTNVITATLSNGTTAKFNIKNGSKGSTGGKGDTGATGAAGVGIKTVTQTTTSNADGGENVITVTKTDGSTSTFTVKNGSKGGKGDTGATGAAGYTPVKFVDYFTPADQESIVQQVIAALGTPVYGTVDENKHIKLSGHLVDGTYTLSFEDTDGFTSEFCTLNKTSAPTYTDLFDISNAKLNTRMSGSSTSEKAQDGYVMVNCTIPLTTIANAYDENTPYLAVPASMWSGSANIFHVSSDGSGYMGYEDKNNTPATVVGDWAKIPLRTQYATTITTTSLIVSLYISGSAITADDLANVQIYYNECPV
ncbi:MAG: hypothetical protein J6V52_05155 [Bacteroidaceae bacterium]|nr:hypothetical protein [Bacteroidaceae bacterium]